MIKIRFKKRAKIRFKKRKKPEMIIDADLAKELKAFDRRYNSIEGEAVEMKVRRMRAIAGIKEMEIEMHERYG